MRWGILVILLAGTLSPAEAAPFDEALQAFRSGRHLSAPAFDEALSRACERRVAELAALGRLSHVDERGRGPGVQSLADGLPPGIYGEILGAGPSERDVWDAWLSSPEHRAVLLEQGWTKWGSAAASSGAVSVFVVRFWRP